MCPLPRKLACNSIGRGFNKGWKRCNPNVAKSWFEGATGELHATLIRTRRHRYGGQRRDLPPFRWAVAGPGRASRRRTKQAPEGMEGAGGNGGPGCGARGRWRGLAGLRDDAPSEARRADGSRAGRRPRARQAARPTQPGPAPGTPARPQTTKPPGPTGGRADQQVSEAHRRTTTMSGFPRPLSWRTLEIPSVAATSFAVPSMRGSS